MYSESEIAEAVRFNRRLERMPRFRAPPPLTRAAIQSAIALSAGLSLKRPSGVRVSSRRIAHQGRHADLRLLLPSGRPRGLHIDFHGGGWTIGRASMGDAINSRIAASCDLAVLSVDYPLLPRTTLSEMIETCATAADWALSVAAQEFGTRSVTMGGESAGAHLALCSALRLRERRTDFHHLAGLVLFYGPYDLAGSPSARNAGPDTLVLDGPRLMSGLQRLTPGEGEASRRHPSVSPLYADLRGLPSVMLIVGDKDPLLDDTLGLAQGLRSIGGEADLIVAPEAPHAFNRFPTRMAERTNARVRDWLSARHADRVDSSAGS
ncbi:MAG: alpha/beta hydrolase [Alphaproteobacteria bacterium]|nr:alpha/beta hydrolase [Alphaproteobacteria bacterium]